MIRIWDRRTGTLLKTIRGHGAPITHLAMSPSGETVFSADVYGYVRSWELARDYGAFREFRVPFRCQDVAWIPHSGRLLVTGGRPIESGGPGPRIAILESASGESLEISDSGTVIMSSDVTGDGRRFVTGVWDGPLEIRDTATGGVVSRMQEKRSGLRRLSLSPDGQLAVAAHGGTVVMWDLERGMPKYERRIDGTIWHVAFHPSGRYFVSASGLSFVSASGRSPGTMRLIAWTADDGERLFDQVCDGRPQSLAFHPGGGQLAVGWIDATMELRSFPENERIRTFPGAQFHASTLDYSPDGTRLAAATRDGVGVWDVTTGQRALHLNHPLAVSAAFSPDGHKLATAASDGTIRIWDAIPMTQKMTE
jgi:WD40 repeat protein